MDKCLHDGGMDYVVKTTGVYMVCRKCRLVLGKCTKFEQVERDDLFKQIDEPKILEQ